MMKAAKPKHQATRRDAVRKYITQHVPGTYLTFEQRQTLASDWNELVRAGCRVTLRQFAAKHGLRCETWRREYNRGATGEAVPDARDRRRRKYAEYDPFKAQDAINDNNANKGTTTMKVTIKADPRIIATSTVQIQGLGKLNGKYFVENVAWTVGGGGACKQTLTLRKFDSRFSSAYSLYNVIEEES